MLHQLLAREKLGISAEQNIGSAACHVGGNRHHTQTSGLRHELGFAFVLLGVEHDVANAFALQDCRKPLRLFNRHRADQHRLPFFVQLRDVSAAALNFSFSVR